MKDIIEQLKNYAHDDVVDQLWLQKNRNHLTAYIDAHPVARTSVSRSLFGFGFMRTVSAFVIALLFVGGVTVAARNSLPGDALYSWKRGVNERVWSALALTDEQKIDYHVTLVDKRFKEVAELSVRPIVDTSAVSAAQVVATAELKSVEEAISKLEQEDKNDAALDATTKLKATLVAHENIITSLSATTPETSAALQTTKEQIKESTKNLSQKSVELQSKRVAAVSASEDGGQAVAKVLGAVETTVAEAAKLVGQTPNGNTLTGQAKTEIAAAQHALEQAKVATGVSDIENALRKAQLAVESATVASTLAKTSSDISSEVKQLLATETGTGTTGEVVVPKGPSFVVSLVTDKSTYRVSDPISFVLSIKNVTDVTQTLQWKTSCQMYYSIGTVYNSQSSQLCTHAETQISLPKGEKFAWDRVHLQSLKPGNYVIIGYVEGYGLASVGLTILENATPSPTSSPTVTKTP